MKLLAVVLALANGDKIVEGTAAAARALVITALVVTFIITSI